MLNWHISVWTVENRSKTSMHSSRMRTARLLPVSPSMHCRGSAPGGCLLLGGVCSCGGVCSWGVSAPRGVSASGPRGCVTQHAMGQTPPPLWTDRHLWKHNLRKLRLRAVIIYDVRNSWVMRVKWHSYLLISVINQLHMAQCNIGKDSILCKIESEENAFLASQSKR